MYQVAFGDHQVANVSADVAARSMGAAVHPTPLEPGRSPDVTPVWDVPRIAAFPYRGSAIVYFDTGPFSEANANGTPAPPTENVPPKIGKDPHEAARRSACGRVLKSDFLRPDSFVGTPCLGAPYFAFDYKGADGQPGQGDTVQPGDIVPLGAEPPPPAPAPAPSAPGPAAPAGPATGSTSSSDRSATGSPAATAARTSASRLPRPGPPAVPAARLGRLTLFVGAALVRCRPGDARHT
jgi:hypothetical protein